MPHAHTWSSEEGRKKSYSKPTLTSMMTTSKSANKRDYDNKGTYDNLRLGDRNISLSTSTLITAAAPARTAVLAKSTLLSWRGRKKSSSTPMLTSMMATLNSVNKWDYNNEGTYDNLQIVVTYRLIDLRNGSETHWTNKTSNDGYRKDTALNEANFSPKKRRPLMEKSNESLVNKAGFVTIEAVNILTNQLAIEEETLHFWKHTWILSRCLQGTQKLPLESSTRCFNMGC